MNYKNTMLAAMLFIAGCTSSEDQNTTITAVQAKPVAQVQAPAADAQGNSDCFDVKMEQWFAAFNEYQDKGFDMHAADKKADEAADKAYEECISGTNLQLAEDQTADEQ